MFKNVKWGSNKFVVAWLFMSFVLVSGVPSRAIAQETGWTISQSGSAAFAHPKDVIQLSVYEQGMTSSMEVSEIRGVLEYDSSLFTVQNVVGNGLGTAGVDNSGGFVLSNSAGKSLGNGDLLFHISLVVRDSASVGKTTVCVNEITISDTSGTSNQISNYVPSTINLEAAASTEEPEDEEFGENEEFEDESYEEDGNWEEEEPEDEQSEEEGDWEEEDWEEDEEEGSSRTILKVEPGKRVTMTKKGYKELHFVLEQGTHNVGYYMVPEGTLSLGVTTTRLEDHLTPQGGTLAFTYNTDSGGYEMYENDITIRIVPTGEE